MKITDIISKLEDFHPPQSPNKPKITDCVKFGNAEEDCTGVVITVYVTPDVIRKAGEMGCNLIICHEPLFYNDSEDTEIFKHNAIYQKKVELLKQFHIVVYRDHDHIHGEPPFVKPDDLTYADGIFYGMMKELEWEDYVIGSKKKPLHYEIPETTAREVAKYICGKFNLNGVRVLGDPDAKARRVYFCEHVTERNDNMIINNTDELQVDCLIPFEIIDWTLSEYVRDSVELGRPRAILEMGHFNLEEGGMRLMEKWLPRVIGDELPIKFVQSGDSFQYISFEQA